MQVLYNCYSHLDYDNSGYIDHNELKELAKAFPASTQALQDKIEGYRARGVTRQDFYHFVVEELLRDCRRDICRPGMRRIIELGRPRAGVRSLTHPGNIGPDPRHDTRPLDSSFPPP